MADQVIEGLWIGNGREPVPDWIDRVVTVTAGPTTPPGQGRPEHRLPFDDDVLAPAPPDVLQAAVDTVRDALARGEQVLLRCQEGINRSRLIAALVLVADGVPPVEAVRRARNDREGLVNPYFVEIVHAWPEVPPPSGRW